MTRFCVCIAGLAAGASVLRAELPKTADELFLLDRSWKASVSLDAKEWEAVGYTTSASTPNRCW